MKEDLKTKIVGWLDRNGYPLEMRVVSALRVAGFNVQQSTFYEDPETHESREIDAIASRTDKHGFLKYSLIIECKKSLNHPWVVFTSDRQAAGKNKFLTYCAMPEATQTVLLKKRVKSYAARLPWWGSPKRTGYGMAVAFAEANADPAYKATIGVLKATIAGNKSEPRPLGLGVLRFLFPIIVFEGRLFESYLDDQGKTIVEETEEVVLNYYRELAGQRTCSVRVVTASRLDAFVLEAVREFEALHTMFKTDLKNMWKRLPAESKSTRNLIMR
jgi:hypothetical protein